MDPYFHNIYCKTPDIRHKNYETTNLLGVSGLSGKIFVVVVVGCRVCQAQLLPTDKLKDTADPTSQPGGAHVITYLRKGKKCCMATLWEEWEKCEKSIPADTNTSEGWGEAASLTHIKTEFKNWEKPGDRTQIPCSS